MSRLLGVLFTVLMAVSASVPAFGQSSQNASSTLVVGMTGFGIPNPIDFNPCRIVVDYYGQFIWLPLLGFNSSLSHMSIVPELARSYTVSANGTVFTFYLRDGLKWSDGQPLTSQDANFSAYVIAQQSVLYNFWAFGPILVPDNSTATGYTIKPGAITTPNSTTIVFHFPSPNAPFIDDGESYFIFPQHVYQGFNFVTANPDVSTIVGDGPFIPTKYIPGAEVDWVANPYYYGGPPQLSAMVYKFFQSATAAELALESGNINLYENAPVTDGQALKAYPGISVKTIWDGSDNYLMFNMSPKLSNNATNPVANLLVRRAIAMSVDLNGTLNSSFGAGNYVPANQLVAPNTMYEGQLVNNATIPTPEYPYDPTAAGKLLDQAGYPAGSDGTRFTLTLLAASTGQAPTIKMLQLMQSQLGQVGIVVQIIMEDTTTFDNAVYSPPPPKSWNIALGNLGGIGDPDAAPLYIVSSLFGNAGPGGWNAGNYINPLVDQLTLEEENTTNPVLRAQVFHRLLGIIHHDLPILELYFSLDLVAFDSNIQGMHFGIGDPNTIYFGNLSQSSVTQIYFATASSTSSSSSTTTSGAPSGSDYYYLLGAVILILLVAGVYVISRRRRTSR